MTNIGGSEGRPQYFLNSITRRLDRLENSLGVIGARIARAIAANQQIFVGPNNPVGNLAPGTEYVWHKTTGDGQLIDTIIGKT